MFELRVRFEGNETSVALGKGSHWTLGRAETCDIVVPDRRVSANHAELDLKEGQLILRRTTGQRPIELNGRPVETAILSAGSTFRIGHTEFTVVAKRDGMNLLDAQTVLSDTWSGLSSATGSSVQPAVGAENQGLRPNEPASPPSRLLSELCTLLAGAESRRALATSVLDLACKRMNATRALLAKVEDAQKLDIIAAQGLPEDADARALISTTVLKQIIDHRQAVIVGNTLGGNSPLGQQASVVRNHICAIACTPVFNARGEFYALLYADNQDRTSEFSPQDAELLIWLGQLYSILDENLEMRRRLQDEVVQLKKNASTGANMIAEAPAMLQLLDRVRKAAATQASVLVLGESGSGKEMIARLIHQQSPRAGKPFVARNCAAIPENLFESEMFGHKKGAFTGADSDRKGAFVEAQGGTLFLDEIGDLDYNLQTKLLRAIQEHVIRPVGFDSDVTVDVRIICATNRNLRELCKDRRFREDLFYRISTVTLNVPPLRERKEEILPLARHFATVLSSGARTLNVSAEQRLMSYDWPGNVRELRSAIEQAVIFAGGSEIGADDIVLADAQSTSITLGVPSLAEVEPRHILQVLQSVNGNKTEAAKQLGLARSTLVLKLQSYERQNPTA